MLIEFLNMLTYAYICQDMLVEVLLLFLVFFLLWPGQEAAHCFLERHKKADGVAPV